MKIKLVVLVILLAIGGSAFGQGQNFPGGGSSSSGSGVPNTINPSVSSALCPGCTAKFDTKVCQAPNLTITNGQNTVTCSVAVFSSADTGKDCFATNHNPQLDSDFGTNVAIMARGTFTFTSSTTGTCTTATGSSSASVGMFFWGTLDDAAWDAAEAAAFTGPQCLPVVVPGGYSMVRKSHFVTPPSTCTNAQTGSFRGMQITGQGKFSSTLVVEPDYNFASDVSNHMFFSLNGMTVKDLSIIGGGQSNIGSNPTAVIIYIGTDAQALNVQMTGIGAANSNMTGLQLDGAGTWDVIIDGAGGTCLNINSGFFNGLAAFAGNCYGANANGKVFTCSGGGNFPSFPQCYVQGAGFQQTGNSPTFTSSMVAVSAGAQLYFDNGQVICNNAQAMQGFSIAGIVKLTNSLVDCSVATTQNVAGITGSGSMTVGGSTLRGGSATVAINAINTSQFISAGGNHIGTNTSGPMQVASTASMVLAPTDVLLNGSTWYNAGGTVLSVASTGTGTSPTNAIDTGSTNERGTFTITAGTTPSASGTITLSFAGTFALNGNAPSCNLTLKNGTGSWNARASVIEGSTSTTSYAWNWDNNAVNLTAASTYRGAWDCTPR